MECILLTKQTTIQQNKEEDENSSDKSVGYIIPELWTSYIQQMERQLTRHIAAHVGEIEENEKEKEDMELNDEEGKLKQKGEEINNFIEAFTYIVDIYRLHVSSHHRKYLPSFSWLVFFSPHVVIDMFLLLLILLVKHSSISANSSQPLFKYIGTMLRIVVKLLFSHFNSRNSNNINGQDQGIDIYLDYIQVFISSFRYFQPESNSHYYGVVIACLFQLLAKHYSNLHHSIYSIRFL